MTTKLVERLEALRSEGNALVKSKEFAQAMAKYSEALTLSEEEFDNDQVLAQRKLLWSNRALCRLELQQFDVALEDCNQVLNVEAGNEKARYRRAQAYVGLGNLTQAFQDTRQLLHANPSNKAAALLARKIQEIVQQDANGILKALESLRKRMDRGLVLLLNESSDAEEALKFLDMKCAQETTSIASEIKAKGGLSILWRTCQLLCDGISSSHAKKQSPSLSESQLNALRRLLPLVLNVLDRVASCSMQLANFVYESSGNDQFDHLLGLLRHEIQASYASDSTVSSTSDSTASFDLFTKSAARATVKLCAFVLKRLILVDQRQESEVRYLLEGLLNGLQSQSNELQLACLDGLLHVFSSPLDFAGCGGKKQPKDVEIKLIRQRFATLLEQMGVFGLLHSKAACLHSASDPLLSRLALVFTQLLSQFEDKDKTLERIVTTHCVEPVTHCSVNDLEQVQAATSSCLILSALFLSNAKLALHAVKSVTRGDGASAVMSCVHEFLLWSRARPVSVLDKRLQEIWIDCVASVCGVEGGTACLPYALRVEIARMLRVSHDANTLPLKASALSIQVKLAVVEKSVLGQDDDKLSAESEFFVDKVFEILEEDEEKRSSQAESSQDSNSKLFWIGASPKERGIEALSYLITFTQVKEAFVARPKAIQSVFDVDFAGDFAAAATARKRSASSSSPGGSRHHGYRSNVYYGVAYILHHVLTTESLLKKKQMEGMEMTPDQYEELQKALKQKSALDDGDCQKNMLRRIGIVMDQDKVTTALVQLLKLSNTKSMNVLEMATLSALSAAEEPSVRGKMVQRGILQALLPIAMLEANQLGEDLKALTKKHKQELAKVMNNARQAISKILITTNPNLIASTTLLSCIKPLLEVCKAGTSQLMEFEALLALTNIASVSEETKDRILQEPKALSTLEYLQFSDHELVRRAATESICNLLPCDQVIEKIFLVEKKLRMWLAFASFEEEEMDFETSRAASGALAMVSQVPPVAWLMIKCNGLETFARLLRLSSREESIHRACFALENLLVALDQGPPKQQVPANEAAGESHAENAQDEQADAAELAKEFASKHAKETKQRLEFLMKSGEFSPQTKEAAASCLQVVVKQYKQ